MSETPKPVKVLISCPMVGGIYDTNPNRWLRSYLTIIADVRRLGWTYAPYFPERMSWFEAMNSTFDLAFENEFDYILRLDDDIWGVGLDYISKLYAADKDVIGACYAIRHFPYVLAALNRINTTEDVIETWQTKRQNFVEADGDGVQPVEMIGFGLTLIKVEPFKLLSRPLFPKTPGCPDDTWFAKVCMDNNIKQFVHMDLKLAHRDITPYNRKYMYNADARFLLQSGSMKDDGSVMAKNLIDKFGVDGRKEIGTLV